MAYVEISHLVKRFGPITAVDDVSFGVERGEVLGFLGPNGAGKSTTMKMITGFLTPESGSVTVAGDSLSESPIAVKRRIGYLPEGAPLYGDMTPGSLLEFVAEIRGYRGQEKRAKVARTIEQVNLQAVVEQPIETLSKGFKRRVGLAQAILHDPEVLVLDEPTDGLDPNQKHEVRTLIRSMAADKVIILSTHILEEVDAVCSRAVIIAGGRLVRDGTPGELEAESPTHNAVHLALRLTGAPDPVRDVLAKLAGVERVDVLPSDNGGLIRFQVVPQGGRSLVASVSQAAREHGWEVEALSIERGRLDEVFRAITIRGRSRELS